MTEDEEKLGMLEIVAVIMGVIAIAMIYIIIISTVGIGLINMLL